MKRAFKVMLLGLIVSAMLATSALAEWVYVTKNGKKYHPENSRFAKMEGVERISKEDAEKRGLQPSKAYLRYLEESEEDKEASASK